MENVIETERRANTRVRSWHAHAHVLREARAWFLPSSASLSPPPPTLAILPLRPPLPQQQWFAFTTKYETTTQRSRARCRYARKGCKLSQDVDECVLEWKIKIIIKGSTMYDIPEYNILRMFANPFHMLLLFFVGKAFFQVQPNRVGLIN